MKTLKIFAVLSLFVVFLNEANCQVTRGSYDWNAKFSAGDCVEEDVTGTITVQQSWTPGSYHEKGRGILTGTVTGDEYKVIFEMSHEFLWHHVVTFGGTFPMLLFHEGKLVAIIHESYRGVVLSDNYFTGPFIHDRYVYSIECK